VTRLAVTGAGGFIGRELVRSMRATEFAVVPLGRAELVASPECWMAGCDAIVHLAARAHVLQAAAAADSDAFEQSNVELTRRVAEAACSAGVGRLVFVSSAGVLGRRSPPGGFDDNSRPAPHDAYTRSKLVAEEMLLEEFRHRIEVVIVRPPLVYGPDAPGNFGRLVRLVRRGWPLPFGALDAPRSMIGLRNLCDALRRAATAPQAGGLRMLVADRESPSVARLIAEMAAALGRRARLLPVPAAVLRLALGAMGRRQDFERLATPFLLRPTLAPQRLGWHAPHRFEDELRWAITASERL
jgi:nucleoside-diphosphate-sugar epimerase